MPVSLRLPTIKQGAIWLARRQMTAPSRIAEQMKLTRPFVSKAQRIAEERIERALLDAAHVNRITLKRISPEHGVAIGRCVAYDAETYLAYSPAIGVQTWFTHSGDCKACAQNEECMRVLRVLAGEWQVSLPDDQPPSQSALWLFDEIRRRLKW